MTASKERWLAAMWPSVRSWLPAPPASVIELGCGSLGGFVPARREDGYAAVGVDPAAPEGPQYRHAEFLKQPFGLVLVDVHDRRP